MSQFYKMLQFKQWQSQNEKFIIIELQYYKMKKTSARTMVPTEFSKKKSYVGKNLKTKCYCNSYPPRRGYYKKVNQVQAIINLDLKEC